MFFFPPPFARVFSLRRVRYGALSPADKQMPQVEKPAKLLLEDMEATPAFAAAKFGLTSRVSLTYSMFVPFPLRGGSILRCAYVI